MSKILVLSLEEDDKRSKLGLQIKVWKSTSNIKTFVRFFKHNGNCLNVVYNGKENYEQIWSEILDMLKDEGVIKDPNNWEYSADDMSKFTNSDSFKNEFAEEQTVFFVFKVKEEFLRF